MTSLFDFLKIQESTDYFVVATMKGLASYANSFLKNIPEERIFLAPGGEASKTFTVYEELLLKIARAKITRNGVIIGIGGGALLDVAGFAAATYLRGVPFYAIPTTLLAMVDAAIGGKTAINLPFAKNIVGAFAEPKSIVNHFPFLDTLSKKDWANGWSEVLKMGLLAGGELWSALKAHPRANNESLFQIIKLAQAFKTHVTTSDFRENVQGGVGRAHVLPYRA